MADPLTTSIATALVTGMTAALSDGTRTLLTKLATLIRDRLRRRSDQDTLDAAIRDPGDHDTIQRLADLISQHMREDPTFAQQLQALWRDINSTAGHNDQVANIISGQVHGSAVQARDVQGGITFNEPSRPH